MSTIQAHEFLDGLSVGGVLRAGRLVCPRLRADADELRYIVAPADLYGPDFPSETFRVLKDKEQPVRNVRPLLHP
jgi:hypothetical protein